MLLSDDILTSSGILAFYPPCLSLSIFGVEICVCSCKPQCNLGVLLPKPENAVFGIPRLCGVQGTWRYVDDNLQVSVKRILIGAPYSTDLTAEHAQVLLHTIDFAFPLQLSE